MKIYGYLISNCQELKTFILFRDKTSELQFVSGFAIIRSRRYIENTFVYGGAAA